MIKYILLNNKKIKLFVSQLLDAAKYKKITKKNRFSFSQKKKKKRTNRMGLLAIERFNNVY